jgi:type I restriction enzyme S subunit
VSDLPTGWEFAKLGEVARWSSGGTPKSDVSEFYGGDIPWVVTGDLTDGLVHATKQTLTPLGLAKSSAKLVPPGTVLVAMYGASIGRVGIAGIPLATNQAIATAQVYTQAVDPKYVLYYLLSQHSVLAAAGKGAAQPNIGQGILKGWPIPIAPLPEQERIVAAIEEQFSRLDAAVMALRSAQTRLRSLKDQGILALVSGAGPRVPLGKVADIRLGRQRSPKNHTGPEMRPYLRAANITWSGLDLTDVKEMNFTSLELSTYALKSGDVLVSEASGSASEVGKPAIWDGRIQNCCFQNTLLRLRSDSLTSDYLYYVLLALARGGTFARASKGVGIHHLSKSGLSALEVEVPSIALQEELVARIRAEQEHFSVLTSAIAAGLHRSNQLRSSILAAAFAGKLVQQNPEDEPASTLLAQVPTERVEFERRQRIQPPSFRAKATT